MLCLDGLNLRLDLIARRLARLAYMRAIEAIQFNTHSIGQRLAERAIEDRRFAIAHAASRPMYCS